MKMKGKNAIYFFAVLEDLHPIINQVESTFNLKYYKKGLFDSDEVVSYSSLFDIENFGYALQGDWVHNMSLLITDKEKSLHIREIPQNRGDIKYAIDQVANPNSVVIRLGGIYENNILVAWSLDTTSKEKFAVDLFSSFSKMIKLKFSKIGGFYVGKQAKEKLNSGWRLVTNSKSPEEYDLSPE